MRPKVVVLGLLWAGLAMARSLGRAGVDVSGIALDRHDFGLRSRYLRTRAFAADDAAALAALREVAGGERIILFPERDAHVAFVLRNWDAVREIADLPFPDDPEPVIRLRRKETVVEEADRAGIPYPRTVSPQTEADVRALDLVPPLLVKPVENQEFAGHFGRKVLVCADAAEAASTWGRARDAGFETVIQELVPDAWDKVYSLFAYIGQSGEPLATIVGRKLRAGPVQFGTSAVFELRPEPRVLDLGLRLLRSAGYIGFAQVELVHDARDDTFKLLEVNTRPPQWGGIAMTKRLDVVRMAYDDLRGEPVAAAPTFDDPDVVWIYGAKDAASSLQMARARDLGPGGFLGPYLRRGKVRSTLALDDPMPMLASLAYLRTKVA